MGADCGRAAFGMGPKAGRRQRKARKPINVGSLPSSTNFLPNCVVASRATVSEETSEPIVAGIIVARKWRRNSLKRLNPRPEMATLYQVPKRATRSEERRVGKE